VIAPINLCRGRDFASPATSSVNHSRGNLTARVSGIQSKENSWNMKMNAATVFRNRSLDFRKQLRLNMFAASLVSEIAKADQFFASLRC
jgi:hypothetical protein